jgi:hypothetical protein
VRAQVNQITLAHRGGRAQLAGPLVLRAVQLRLGRPFFTPQLRSLRQSCARASVTACRERPLVAARRIVHRCSAWHSLTPAPLFLAPCTPTPIPTALDSNEDRSSLCAAVGSLGMPCCVHKSVPRARRATSAQPLSMHALPLPPHAPSTASGAARAARAQQHVSHRFVSATAPDASCPTCPPSSQRRTLTLPVSRS